MSLTTPVPDGTKFASGLDDNGNNVERVAINAAVPTSTGAGIVITVSTAVKKHGSGYNLPAGTTHVMVTVKVGDVMWSENGDPTATTGSGWLPAGSVEEMTLATALAFIRADTSPVDAIVILAPRKYVSP